MVKHQMHSSYLECVLEPGATSSLKFGPEFGAEFGQECGLEFYFFENKPYDFFSRPSRTGFGPGFGTRFGPGRGLKRNSKWSFNT